MWGKKLLSTLKFFSIAYVVLILLSFAASLIATFPSFAEVGHLKHGCYWTNALVGYIECRGLPYNGLIKLFLNFWMMILYYGMFTLNVSFSMGWILTVLGVLMLYSPLFYLIWYWKRGQYI